MLTLFAMPKPFRGHIGIIQENAIRSWTLLQPRPRILLFGDEEGTAETADRLGVCHVPQIARNEFGTPLLDGLVRQAETLASSDTLCYINSDILLMSDFMPAVTKVTQQQSRFLMGGRRWNFDLTERLAFEPDWEATLREQVAARGELFLAGAIDYFVYSRGLWGDLPPFAIGRTVWDNWLLYRARALKAPLIDATSAVMAVHQNHDYGHHTGGKAGVWDGPEAQRNRQLAGGEHHLYTLNVATHVLTPRGLARRRPGRWQLEHLQTLWQHGSRQAHHSLQRAASGPFLQRLPARTLLGLIRLSGPARRRLGRAITAWRDRK